MVKLAIWNIDYISDANLGVSVGHALPSPRKLGHLKVNLSVFSSFSVENNGISLYH